MPVQIRVSLLAIMLLLIAAPTSAQEKHKSMINAYKQHDYAKAAQLAEEIINKEPKNAEVRYYLGNSFVELHQLDLAKAQYKRCMDLAPNSELSHNSNAALQHLLQFDKQTKNQQHYRNNLQSSYGPPHNQSSHGPSNAQRQGGIDAEERQRIKDETNERIRMKEHDAQLEIEKIHNQASADIADMPGRHHGRRSGYFRAGKEEVNEEAQQKINKIKRALEKDKRDIMKDAKRTLRR